MVYARQTPPTLEVENVIRRYKSSGRGVEGVSLEVHPGEVFGLMGPNGSGKSTLLRVLSTAIAPQSGSFRIGGADGVREKREARARMGLMVDRPTHYGDLSGWANAYLFARSYGMGKKLALIEAMAHGPELLLLDEPSLGLDYTSQLAYQKKIRELSSAGVAVLVASNQVDEVEAMCDRVAFLHKGRLAALGTPEEFVSSFEGLRRIVATLRNPVEYDPLGRIAGVERITPEGSDLVVHCAERPGLVADVVAGIVGSGGDITDLAVRRPSLEDVYVKLTGEALRDED